MKILSLFKAFVIFLALIALSANGIQVLASPPVEAPESVPIIETADHLIFLPFISGPNQISLELWHTVSGEHIEAYKKILDEYHQLHPNVTIDETKPDDIITALLAAVPKEMGPDIILWDNFYIGEAESQNLIVPIENYISGDYIINTYEPAAVKGVTYKDQVWGLPNTQEGIALIYNKDVISNDELPNSTDYSDMLLKAEQYQQSHPGKTFLCSQGLGGADAYHVAPIYFGHGLKNYGGYVDENGVAYLDTPEALAAANWIKNFRPYGYLESNYDNCLNALIAGDIAIWWTGPWALESIKNSGINYGIAPMGNPFVGSEVYVITPNAISRGHEDAIIDLLEYLGSAEVQKQLTLTNYTTPANTAALYDPTIQAIDDIKQFGLAYYVGVPLSNSVYASCQWDPVGTETLNVWLGKKTPAKAMADAQTAIEACIAGLP